MANLQHLERLHQGVQRWNQWRLNNPGIVPDLSGATLLAAQLSGVNFSGAKLHRVQLDKAELSGANLYKADLTQAHLSEADLSGAKLRKARLRGVNLARTDLRGANLTKAHLPDVDLSGANLSGANLSGANLCRANLSSANLSSANLSGAALMQTQVLGTVFAKAMLTGACIQDWTSNGATILEGVICDHIYLKDVPKERHPKTRNFKPGEFARGFQQTTRVIDLVFQGRIDWQAFSQAFQTLCQEYVDANLCIQSIEKKQGGAFVVRLAMAPDTDAAVIESRAKEQYMVEMHTLDAQYKRRLRSQGYPFSMARHSINMERRDKATLMGVLTTMANSQQGPKYRIDNTSLLNSLTTTGKNIELNGYDKHPAHIIDDLRKKALKTRTCKLKAFKNVEPVQAKIIEMLLSGMSPSRITKVMQLDRGQVSLYQRQSTFRTAFWRAFLKKMLDFVGRLLTILQNLTTDAQISSKYRLWLIKWWVGCFFATVDYQGPPHVPVLQSEIIHLLLFGMTLTEVSDALMIDPRQVNKYRQQPAFRVAFWHAYCQKLLVLISKATDTAKALLANPQMNFNCRLIAVGYLFQKCPTDFTRTLERIELEQMACVLISISAGQISGVLLLS